MGEMGYGYGSEWQLLRYLGRHPEFLNQRIEALDHLPESSARMAGWLDFAFNPRSWTLDGEWKALDFLPVFAPVRQAWLAFWPNRGEPPNWDAIGRIRVCGTEEWLLVEAKARISELQSTCGAAEHGGRPKIRRALNGTRRYIDNQDPADVDAGEQTMVNWMSPYYQYANRLTALRFLLEHNVPARLLLIYFYGDQHPNGDAPQTPDEWSNVIMAMRQHLGLSSLGRLSPYVHSLFLPVCPGGSTHPVTRNPWYSPRQP